MRFQFLSFKPLAKRCCIGQFSNWRQTMKKIVISTRIILSVIGMTISVIPAHAGNYTINSASTIQNNGNILDGDDELTITNKGSITTSANSDEAINITGDNVTIINEGTIQTSGSLSEAILGKNSVSVTNYAQILTTGSSTKGIVLENDAVVINHGTIKTLNSNADSIIVRENSVIKNFGSISTSGSGSEGIRAGENSKIYNSGTITTASEGILTTGDYVEIINTGTILTSGNNSDGIDIENNNTVTNTGTVTTSDDGSDAIFAKADNTIKNSGVISTSGEGSHSVHFTGSNNHITNTGSIKVKGINSYGIGADNTGSITINNSGYIEGTNTGSYAVFNDDTAIINTTLNLKSGSIILGAIDLGNNAGDMDVVNIYGASPSASITINNAEQINLFTSGVQIGNTVTTVDSTSEKSNSIGLVTLVDSIHDSINRRKVTSTPLNPVSDTPYIVQQSNTWVNTFVSQRKFASTDQNTQYDYKQYSVNAGYEWDYKHSRVGVTAGGAHLIAESTSTSFENQSSYLYAGVYGVFNFTQVMLTSSLITGYGNNKKKRYVYDNTHGLETAESDPYSLFISPSVNLQATYAINESYEFRPSASLTYNISYMDSYQESGTTQSNLRIKSRYVEAFSSHAQLAIAKKFDSEKEIELRVGMNARSSHDDNVDASLNGTRFNYSIKGDDSVHGFYTGANMQIAKKDNFLLVADLEAGSASNDEEYINASLQLKINF
jgi:hypothetical protein